MSLEAYIACNRFGLGARGDELNRVAVNPRAWLQAQIKNPLIPDLVKRDHGGKAALDIRQEKKKARKDGMPDEVSKTEGGNLRKVYAAENTDRIRAQITSTQPFVERLTMFWSNHFAVSIQKGALLALVNRYEAEAIRPHIGGYFRDMVLATARHPVMLAYLDNGRSFGEHSRIGQNREKGLNENYARELMELHTLGVGSGYTQQDVIQLARILTGWSYDKDWNYNYRALAHELGPKTLLGKTFTEKGEQEGVDAIDMLCAHPATAKHIATKLVKHFISDTPDAGDIAAVAQAFQTSKGHLPTVIEALIARENAWKAPLNKIKNPYEFLVAAYRITGLEPQKIIPTLNQLNYRPFNANSPAGESDTVAELANPDAIMKRIDFAHTFSQRLTAKINPLELAKSNLGEGLTEATARTIQQAASGQDGLAFLILSPEFQRR